MRSVPEWKGATDDTPIPARVKVRIFDAYGGVCYLSHRKIMPGDKWQCEHIVAIINGGQNRETNLAPALVEPHKIKTKEDVRIKAKTARIRKRHLGIKKRGRTIGGRKFDGTPIFPKWR